MGLENEVSEKGGLKKTNPRPDHFNTSTLNASQVGRIRLQQPIFSQHGFHCRYRRIHLLIQWR